jgi:hypothetical protein
MEKKPSKGINEGTWYIMRNIKGLKDEPFSSGRIDYLQRIDFQLSNINAPGYYEEVRTTWEKMKTLGWHSKKTCGELMIF